MLPWISIDCRLRNPYRSWCVFWFWYLGLMWAKSTNTFSTFLIRLNSDSWTLFSNHFVICYPLFYHKLPNYENRFNRHIQEIILEMMLCTPKIWYVLLHFMKIHSSFRCKLLNLNFKILKALKKLPKLYNKKLIFAPST